MTPGLLLVLTNLNDGLRLPVIQSEVLFHADCNGRGDERPSHYRHTQPANSIVVPDIVWRHIRRELNPAAKVNVRLSNEAVS